MFWLKYYKSGERMALLGARQLKMALSSGDIVKDGIIVKIGVIE